MLGIALFYILAVPYLNTLVKGDNPFEAGQPYVMFDAYQITPQEGWEVEVSELFVTLTKSGASMVFPGPLPPDETPEDAMQKAIDGLKADTTTTWVVGDPTTFATTAGDHGVEAVAHSDTQAWQSWIITNGESNIQVLSLSPDSIWGAIKDEMEAMMTSVVYLDGEAGQ